MQLVGLVDVKKQTEQNVTLKICDCIGNSKGTAVRKRADCFFLELPTNFNCIHS